jgi:hypothetical protein
MSRRRPHAYTPCAAGCGEAVPIEGLDPKTDLDRVTCTAMRCRAHIEWTPERWDGAARMAAARRHAGITLTGLDLEALDRTARTGAPA